MASHTSTNTRPFVFHFDNGLVILASGQNCQEAEDLAMDYAFENGLLFKRQEPKLTDWLTWEEAVSKYPEYSIALTKNDRKKCILAIINFGNPNTATPYADDLDFPYSAQLCNTDADDFDFESDADVFHTPDADVFINPEHAWV